MGQPLIMSMRTEPLLSSYLKDAWLQAVLRGPFITRYAECEDKPEPKKEVKEAADDLEKILSGEGGPMDREEMMEAMMSKGGGGSMTPYPFEKVMDNLRGVKHSGQEPADGIVIEVGLPLGNNFQLGSEWSFTKSEGAKVEFSTNVNNITGNPMKMPDDMKQANFKYGSDESCMFAGVMKLPFGVQMQS